MLHPTDRIAHTTAFVTPVVEHWLEREIAQWVHPMKDRSDDPSHHERTLLPRSYISLGWDPVQSREPSTYQPITGRFRHCVIEVVFSVCVYFRAYIHLKFLYSVLDTSHPSEWTQVKSSQLGFNVHIRRKLL